MQWGVKFCDFAFENQFRLVNYPETLEQAGQIIGSVTFNAKKITLKQFKEFMPAFEKANNPNLAAAATDDGDDDDDNDAQQAVGLVAWDESKYFAC